MYSVKFLDTEMLSFIKKDIEEFCEKEGLIFNMAYKQSDYKDNITEHTEMIHVIYGKKEENEDDYERDFYTRESKFCKSMEGKYNMWFYFDYRGLESKNVLDYISVSHKSRLKI